MSVGHTPTTQTGAICRPPPPPGGIGRGSPLPPQDGAIGGNPPPGINQQGNNQPKNTESGLPNTLEACKIAFNKAIYQFNDLQEKILLFSHHLKQPFDQATGYKIEHYFNQLIIITEKLEKIAHHADKKKRAPRSSTSSKPRTSFSNPPRGPPKSRRQPQYAVQEEEEP